MYTFYLFSALALFVTEDHDSLYADPLSEHGLFAFDESVARVFPDMIKRSVPGYSTIVAMTGLLAGKYATAESSLYDLGCSLGASTLAMRQNILQPNCKIISVDNSNAMLDRCKSIIDTDTHDTPVELTCADLQDVVIQNASVVVLNFTLQFVCQNPTTWLQVISLCRGSGQGKSTAPARHDSDILFTVDLIGYRRRNNTGLRGR